MKVKWKVYEAPTGQYRTFFERGWPTARSECQFFFMVRCEDEYVPAKAKIGDHGPLTLAFRDDTNPGGKFADLRGHFPLWVRLKSLSLNLKHQCFANEVQKHFI